VTCSSHLWKICEIQCSFSRPHAQATSNIAIQVLCHRATWHRPASPADVASVGETIYPILFISDSGACVCFSYPQAHSCPIARFEIRSLCWSCPSRPGELRHLVPFMAQSHLSRSETEQYSRQRKLRPQGSLFGLGFVSDMTDLRGRYVTLVLRASKIRR